MANATEIQIRNGQSMPIRDLNAHTRITTANNEIAKTNSAINEQYDEKLFCLSPNMYDKRNAGIRPGYYATSGGWTSTGGDARLGTTHPLYLIEGKTYKWKSAESVYGVNNGYAWGLEYPGSGEITSMDNVATVSGGYCTVTINRTGWYVVNIDMTAKDLFMFCLESEYPDNYIAYTQTAEAERVTQAQEAYKKLFSLSPNLFNRNAADIQTTRFISGSVWVDSQGDTRLATTHPLYLEEGVTYKFRGYYDIYGADNGRCVCRIDNSEDMNIVGVTEGTFDSDNIFVTWTCPASGYYVVNINGNEIGSYMFCPQELYPSGYVSYYSIGNMAEDYPNVFLTFGNDGKPEHRSIADVSPNLFNKDSSELNLTRWGNPNGWQPSNDDPRLGATHPIYLEAGKSYKWVGAYDVYGDQNGRTAFYLNSQGEIVSIDQRGTWTDSAHSYVLLNCTRSGYYVIDINKQTIASFMICEANKFPDFYAEYGVLYANNNMKYNAIDIAYAPLKGKVLVCDGDSIAAATPDDPEGRGGWFGRLKEDEMISGANYAIGGGTITYLSDSRHCISRSLSAIHTDYPTLDYLILEGGTNDADLIGQWSGDTPPANFGTWSETDFSGNYDDTTFCGAVEAMFYRAINYWQNAHIGFIVAMEMGTNLASLTNRKRYFDEIVKIAKKWHIPVLNLWDNSGADARLTAFYDSSMSIAENVAAHKFYRDGQHPSSYGYNKMQPMINAWVKSL